MKERPILFKGEMVRAILQGRKTMTRRIATKDDSTERIYWVEDVVTIPDGKYTGWVKKCGAPLLIPMKCPYGQKGGRLWVRETWSTHDESVLREKNLEHIYYRADDEKHHETDGQWRPSIHMPRWASRITLEITDVRVERLQQISEEDAMAEGLSPSCPSPDGQYYLSALGQFYGLWEKIHGRGSSWDKNPYVWVISFRRIT